MTFDPAKPEEGVFPNLDEKIYRAANAISQSSLKEMEYSPAHFRAKMGVVSEPTDAQIIGTLTHALVLQGRCLFVPIPANAPRRPSKTQREAKKPSPETIGAIEWWKHFESSNQGREILDQETCDSIQRIRDSVMAHPIARTILERATSKNVEVACFQIHEETGLMLKGLADVVVSDDKNLLTIPDLKTCLLGGASKEEFSRAIYNFGYFRQAAFYLDLFGASFFMFIAVEKEPPYAVACYNLDKESIERGRQANERDLRTVRKCLDENHWPAYSDKIETIGVPDWVKRREV